MSGKSNCGKKRKREEGEESLKETKAWDSFEWSRGLERRVSSMMSPGMAEIAKGPDFTLRGTRD